MTAKKKYSKDGLITKNAKNKYSPEMTWENQLSETPNEKEINQIIGLVYRI